MERLGRIQSFGLGKDRDLELLERFQITGLVTV